MFTLHVDFKTTPEQFEIISELVEVISSEMGDFYNSSSGYSPTNKDHVSINITIKHKDIFNVIIDCMYRLKINQLVDLTFEYTLGFLKI